MFIDYYAMKHCGKFPGSFSVWAFMGLFWLGIILKCGLLLWVILYSRIGSILYINKYILSSLCGAYFCFTVPKQFFSSMSAVKGIKLVLCLLSFWPHSRPTKPLQPTENRHDQLLWATLRDGTPHTTITAVLSNWNLQNTNSKDVFNLLGIRY